MQKKSQYIDGMVKQDLNPWFKRWQDGRIAFHQDQINQDLIDYVKQYKPVLGKHVLVPMSGKSKDMLWLLQQGFTVTGVEIAPKANEAFFKEHDLEYSVKDIKDGKLYSAPQINIIEKSIFALNHTDLQQSIDWVYDRAALIALPKNLRKKYAKHIQHMAEHATHMLCISMEKIETEVTGPPFSVVEEEVKGLYSNWQYKQIKRSKKNDSLDKVVYHLEQ